jgi:hypothetical protein
MIKTWEKDEIGTTNLLVMISSSLHDMNMAIYKLGTTTQGHGGIIVFNRKSICPWVSHLASTHLDIHKLIRIHNNIGLYTDIYIGICHFSPSSA